jgi:hypothetical protein
MYKFISDVVLSDNICKKMYPACNPLMVTRASKPHRSCNLRPVLKARNLNNPIQANEVERSVGWGIARNISVLKARY